MHDQRRRLSHRQWADVGKGYRRAVRVDPSAARRISAPVDAIACDARAAPLPLSTATLGINSRKWHTVQRNLGNAK
jgi:hypothetical protein